MDHVVLRKKRVFRSLKRRERPTNDDDDSDDNKDNDDNDTSDEEHEPITTLSNTKNKNNKRRPLNEETSSLFRSKKITHYLDNPSGKEQAKEHDPLPLPLPAQGQENVSATAAQSWHAHLATSTRYGPKKTAGNVRTTCRFDYQPDICKDYKETGFCGFGDSCIFLHDRSDYKSGWQLEREWEQQTNTTRKNLSRTDETQTDEKQSVDVSQSLPFACYLCRDDFVNPVKTVCGHYFCEQCAMKHYQETSKKCSVCQQPTMGIFHVAKELATTRHPEKQS